MDRRGVGAYVENSGVVGWGRGAIGQEESEEGGGEDHSGRAVWIVGATSRADNVGSRASRVFL